MLFYLFIKLFYLFLNGLIMILQKHIKLPTDQIVSLDKYNIEKFEFV